MEASSPTEVPTVTAREALRTPWFVLKHRSTSVGGNWTWLLEWRGHAESRSQCTLPTTGTFFWDTVSFNKLLWPNL